MRTEIIGTGSFAPPHKVTNEDLAKIVETSDEWIRTRTGIIERRISDGMGVTEMAARAAQRALDDAGIRPEEIELIVVATTTADYCFPSAACEIQGILGAVHAVAYDISAACSGFIFALDTADAFIRSGKYHTGLVIGADNLSKIVDWTDRSTCVLFGDGAGAAVVRGISETEADFAKNPAEKLDIVNIGDGISEKSRTERTMERGVIRIETGSDGKKSSVLQCQSRTVGNFLTGTKPEPGYITMEGQEVFKFAVKKVPECIQNILCDSNVTIEDIKYVILHQANYRICESIAKRLKISMDKIPMNIETYGNTSGATIPMLLDELNREGKLKKGDQLILAGFGAGLTWGAALIRW